MTIGSPRRFISQPRQRHRQPRGASGPGGLGCRGVRSCCDVQPPGSSVGPEDRVVDQARAADAGGDGDERLAVERGPRGQGLRGARARGTRARRRASCIAARAAPRSRAGVALAAASDASAARSARCSASARSRSSPRRWTLRLDSARPSGSRTVGRDLDAHRQVEVGDEPADHERLLGVLLAEEGDVGAATMLSSLVTTVVTPWKCSAPRWAPSSVSVSAPPTGTVVAKPGRVDLARPRGEQHVGARLRGQRGVVAPRRAGRRPGRRRR